MSVQSPKHKLTRAARGWIKRVNGKPRWICSVTVAPTGEQADKVYEQKFADLWADEKPDDGVFKLTNLCNLYLDRKHRALATGDLNQRTHDEYVQSAAVLCAFELPDGRTLGSLPANEVTPEMLGVFRDHLGRRWGPHRLKKFVILVRSIFKYGANRRWVEPLDLSEEFPLPSKRSFRLARKAHDEEHGKKIFTPAECRQLIGAAAPHLRAMILLALNGGFGNGDLSALPWTVIGRDGWVEYARPKTGIERRVPLWPETIAALNLLPKVPGNKLVFVTPKGNPFIVSRVGSHKDQISMQFLALCRRSGIRRQRRGFYSLRRLFRTLADEQGDQRAAALIMGHDTETDMGGVYVQAISDQRLKTITEFIRQRIFTPSPTAEPATAAAISISASPAASAAEAPKRRRGIRGKPAA